MRLGYIFHAMQYEMNATNRFTTNHQELGARRDQKKTGVKQGGTGTCENTTSVLMTTHSSEVFIRLAELIAV